MEKEEEEEKAKRRAEKQPGFDGRWYTDVNAHKRCVSEILFVNLCAQNCLFKSVFLSISAQKQRRKGTCTYF